MVVTWWVFIEYSMSLGCHLVVGVPAKFSKRSTSCKSSAHAVPCQEQCSLWQWGGASQMAVFGWIHCEKRADKMQASFGENQTQNTEIKFQWHLRIISDCIQIARWLQGFAYVLHLGIMISLWFLMVFVFGLIEFGSWRLAQKTLGTSQANSKHVLSTLCQVGVWRRTQRTSWSGVAIRWHPFICQFPCTPWCVCAHTITFENHLKEFGIVWI